ncbi:hypothetical protein J2Z21_001221 [Streptomyces griseochromogenes]|uniref:Uncharacterized protein n=1 Tax=Streptomyces griseochromogenes TaxID=68214 RepID=A0ABS4LLN9_9ACTN|nr:hypothetical protein [Streptomyces griseochromogenes]MBP2048297.1 hypothetical protein [Streptomyces griseochromogenes]
MARHHPQPRHITLGGREAVALTVREYEQLVASRRQIGGQSARVRVLAQQVKRDARLLRELEALVADPASPFACHAPGAAAGTPDAAGCPGHDGTADGMDPACLRCAIAALLRRHREEKP